jgi:Flp pilus assembly pilin Flp
MLKKLLKDESGLTTVEALALTVAGALIAIIAFAGIRGGVRDAATHLGTKIKTSVDNNGASW